MAVPPPIRFAAAAEKAPSGSLVGAVTYDPQRFGRFTSSMQVPTGEYVPELLNRTERIRQFEMMGRKTHLWSLRRAVRLVLEGFDYYVDRGQASEATAKRVAANLCLPVGVDGEEPDQRAGIAWGEHLRLASDAPIDFGHAHFEAAVSRKASGPFAGSWWIDRLESRPQNTLIGERVSRGGDLQAVIQEGFDRGFPVDIDADRLVSYVFDARPGDFMGEPLLRACWEAEFYRDLFTRIDARAAEVGGVGVPAAEYFGDEPETADMREAAEYAVANYMGGGGVRMPKGYRMAILTAQGQRDVLASVKHHEQKSSAAFMASVMELGTTGQGNRALGDTFQELWLMGVTSIAEFLCRTATNQIVRRLVDWNEGPDAAAPVVRVRTGSEVDLLTLEEMAKGVDAGLIQASMDLLSANHKRYGLPEPTEDEPTPLSAAPTPVIAVDGGEPAETPVEVTAAAGTVGREPTLVEAAVRFDEIDRAFRTGVAALVAKLRSEKTRATDRLADEAGRLASEGDLTGLSELNVGPVGAAALVSAATATAETASAGVVTEAAEQGVRGVPAALDEAATLAVETRAQAQALTLGGELSRSASARALDAVSAGLVSEVAGLVRDHLDSLTDARLERAASVTLTGAIGEGRTSGQRAAEARSTEVSRYYGSAMLDGATCNACSASDGAEFKTLEDAMAVYPGGSHHVACEGGNSCRCLVVQVFTETEATR